MQCVILCGGFGTRMLPLTTNIPKAMININDKPFIHYQIAWLVKHGINNIILSIGHFGSLIRDFIGDKYMNVPIIYADEGESLLGTAGALRLALPSLEDLFAVTYGDSFLPINYLSPFQYYVEKNIDALMTVYKNNGQFDKSNVLMDDKRFVYDKKNPSKDFQYIDYGLSILNKQIIDRHVPKNMKYGLDELFKNLSINNRLHGYEVYDRFYEIGSFQGLKDFTDWVNINGKCFNNI
jgi:MurNAc alpha-1-phosphate uridylyltransferase